MAIKVLAFSIGLILLSRVGCADPLLFFYPPPFKPPNEERLTSPQTLTRSQATVEVPTFNRMSGVVVLVYWSTICPQENLCNFDLINDILDYWRGLKKKVVLSVATIGYPILLQSTAEPRLLTATPEWVMANVRTYRRTTRLLAAGKTESGSAFFPDFRDPAFMSAIRRLIGELARRYDGDPVIAQLRIATGIMGEDNPLVGPPGMPMRGYDEGQWLRFTQEVAAAYFSWFRKTQLEFDIGRLSWAWARGNSAERRSVDDFVNQLLAHQVLLAFNGLGGAADRHLVLNPEDGEARSLHYLEEFRQRGGQTGLEAIGLLSSPLMRPIEGIIATIKALHPTRLVFFDDFAAAVSQHERGIFIPANERAAAALQIYDQLEMVR